MPDAKQTMARMGYANMIDAITLSNGSDVVEIGLIGPGPYGDRYAVAVHVDCDPTRPTQGSSGVDASFASVDAARRGYEAAIAEHRRST